MRYIILSTLLLTSCAFTERSPEPKCAATVIGVDNKAEKLYLIGLGSFSMEGNTIPACVYAPKELAELRNPDLKSQQ